MAVTQVLKDMTVPRTDRGLASWYDSHWTCCSKKVQLASAGYFLRDRHYNVGNMNAPI